MAATPAISSTLPAALLALVVGAGAAVELPPDAAAELAAAEEVDAAGTSVGMRVPHVLQEVEPGFCWRHWAKVASQMKLGRVPWYWSMFAGAELLAQMHLYWRDDCGGREVSGGVEGSSMAGG